MQPSRIMFILIKNRLKGSWTPPLPIPPSSSGNPRKLLHSFKPFRYMSYPSASYAELRGLLSRPTECMHTSPAYHHPPWPPKHSEMEMALGLERKTLSARIGQNVQTLHWESKVNKTHQAMAHCSSLVPWVRDVNKYWPRTPSL